MKYAPFDLANITLGDFDYDGRPETGAAQAVSMLSLEDVTVPVGTFRRALRFETIETDTISYSSQVRPPVINEQRVVEWYAPGVGLVKRYTRWHSEETTDELIAYVVGDDRHGIMPVGWLAHDLRPLAGVAPGVDHPAVASDGHRFLVVVPSDNEEGGGPNGNMLVTVVDQEGKKVSSAPLSTTRDVQYAPSLAWNGRRYLLAYVNQVRGVEVVSLSASGEKLSGPTVLDEIGWAPHVTGTDSGFLVAYAVEQGNVPDGQFGGMWVAKLDDAGTKVSAVRAYPDTAQAEPVLARDDVGGLMALFRVPVTGPAASLHFGDSLAFARLTPDGHALDPAPTFLHESLDEKHRDYNLIFDGTGYLASWNQSGSTEHEVHVARISRAGKFLGAAGGTTIVGAGYSPRMIGFGSASLMIWGQRLSDDYWDQGIGGTRLSQEGYPLDPTSKGGHDSWLVSGFAATADTLYAVAWGGDRALIVWTGYEDDHVLGLNCAVGYPW